MLPLGIAAFCVAAAASDLSAQGTIRGVVNDSLIENGPLAGATVILQGAPHTAVTDRAGRFVMRDVPAGTYAIGFFHPVLDSLEATAPLRRVEVKHGETVIITLGVPSANTLSLAFCGYELEPASAVVYGVDAMPLMRNSRGTPCMPNVWIDGALQHNVAAWELRTHLMGARWMEVYPSSANRPPEFTSSTDCGALVIWTR